MATFSGTLGWARKAFPSIWLSEVRSWRVKMIRIREGQVIHMKVQWWAVWPLCRNFRLGSWSGLSEGSVALLYNCNQGYLPSLWHWWWWSSTQYDQEVLDNDFPKICWAFNYLPLTSDPKFIFTEDIFVASDDCTGGQKEVPPSRSEPSPSIFSHVLAQPRRIIPRIQLGLPRLFYLWMIIFNFIFFELLDKTGTVLLNSKMVNQFSAMTFPTGLDSIPTHQLEFPVIDHHGLLPYWRWWSWWNF